MIRKAFATAPADAAALPTTPFCCFTATFRLGFASNGLGGTFPFAPTLTTGFLVPALAVAFAAGLAALAAALPAVALVFGAAAGALDAPFAGAFAAAGLAAAGFFSAGLAELVLATLAAAFGGGAGVFDPDEEPAKSVINTILILHP